MEIKLKLYQLLQLLKATARNICFCHETSFHLQHALPEKKGNEDKTGSLDKDIGEIHW